MRKICGGKVLAGFAGSAADGITLLEKFEAKFGEYKDICAGPRSSWRRTGGKTARCAAWKRLLIVGNPDHLFVLSGTGDVIEPDEGIAAIGSGGPYAQAAAAALLRNTPTRAPTRSRAKRLEIAGEICIYTNDDITVESLP